MQAVIVAGCVCMLVAAAKIDLARADLYLLVLTAFTVGVASRITLQIPRFKSHISVSDTFTFLILLLYGGEFAVLIAAVEAFVSSWRFCNRRITVLFNASAMAVSCTAVIMVLKAADLYTEDKLHGHGGDYQSFVIALSLIALVSFLTNTALASVYGALKDGIRLWETWTTKYIWTFLTYFVGAAAAGLLVQLTDLLGSGVILASFPVIFFVFLTYRMYLRNVEMSLYQAEQAGQYAKVLEERSDALRESEERFRSAFDYAPIGIGLVSPSGKFLKANRALSDILGYTEAEFLATDFQAITFSDDLGPTLVKIHEILTGRIASCQMEQRYVHKTGRTVWASWSVSTTSDSRSRQPNLIFQLQDITDRKSAEEKLQHDATHDALTGLPNRAYFMTRLDESLQKSQRFDGYRSSVLFIDLDRFKYVNDSLGHLVGDDLLKELALRLRECMRPSDLVARLGGDEFTILIEGRYDLSEVTRIADRIQAKLRQPFDLRGHEVYSSASIGILHASDKHLTPEEVMRDADTAMYQAKRAGKARHEIFDERMHKAAMEILRLETDLRRAVERHEIAVCYQPIFSFRTGEFESVEALARWEHPELGSIPPSKFIGLAEEIGIVDRLAEQVLATACRDINQIRSEYRPSVTVNLSCRQFSQPNLVNDVTRILAEADFSPDRLKIEITESVFFTHQDRAIAMLNELREHGIEIYIDDFGTGYSNLGYLQKLPVSALKIDRSFVSMIDSPENDEIVRAIVTLARNLGLKVVAEGVETEVQLEALKLLDCEHAQGFLFARPMNIADLREFLEGTGGGLGKNPAYELPNAPFVQ